MTSPSLTLRIKKQRVRSDRRAVRDVAEYLDDRIWRRFYVSLGEQHRARARALAWGLILIVSFVLSASALRGCW